jgi:SAM-dependent methyltransferase
MMKKLVRHMLEKAGYDVQKRLGPQSGNAVAEVCAAAGTPVVAPSGAADYERDGAPLFASPAAVPDSFPLSCHKTVREAVQNISMQQYFVASETAGGLALEDQPATNDGGRKRMIHAVCRGQFGKSLDGASVLDVACSSGYYSFLCSRWGAARVVGVDARPEHEDQFRLVGHMLGIPEPKCRFLRGDVEFGLEQITDTFDLVLCMGVMYHVFDHPRFVKNLFRLTRKVLVLEGACSGRRDNLCKADIEDPLKLRESVHGPVLYPSLPWMIAMLRWAGFKDVRYVAYPSDLPDAAGYAGLWRAMLVAVK